MRWFSLKLMNVLFLVNQTAVIIVYNESETLLLALSCSFVQGHGVDRQTGSISPVADGTEGRGWGQGMALNLWRFPKTASLAVTQSSNPGGERVAG